MQALGVSQDSVNKDLLLYKSILSKMAAAKVCLSLLPPVTCFFWSAYSRQKIQHTHLAIFA